MITLMTMLFEWAEGIQALLRMPVVSGLVGIVIGAFLSAWLVERRERAQRRLAFIEKQLKEFYSPMLGLRQEIHMRGEIRVRIEKESDKAWRAQCEIVRRRGEEALEAFSKKRGPEFTSHIEYNNRQLNDVFLPAYRHMVALFRDNFWLTDLDTREHYPPLIEFIEIWDRWIGDTIPPEVLENLEHSGSKLDPFFDHLQKRHDELRNKIKQGKA